MIAHNHIVEQVILVNVYHSMHRPRKQSSRRLLERAKPSLEALRLSAFLHAQTSTPHRVALQVACRAHLTCLTLYLYAS